MFISKIPKNLKEEFRVMIESQFEHDLYNNSFGNQLQSDGLDTSQQRTEWWMMVVDRVGPIPNNVYDYSFQELSGLYRKAIDPEMQELVKALRDRHIVP